ncbi:hypothetical protein SODALDRAFT_337051 [Sodiomyces alkalinus F11]|uniref:Serine/threonine-protein kinase ppk6 n=1 Tax=Sodiomyces alkalinus (strain CBS 110278 / VKM F-3762 / F11) TaxID=1314773 RepID=A0A3N2PMJ3_SODAK|nr:hypothetical protein SODALDRAFT_337051 [Sodiomyces alkalinus F11]ROT35733.1 hypothetical protein SODALDRAFT_337051 [Sodiomyces alkalinus F11]
MSADLLAELDSFYKKPASQSQSQPAQQRSATQQHPLSSSIWDSSLPTTANPVPQPTQSGISTTQQNPSDDDAWGGFTSFAGASGGENPQAARPIIDVEGEDGDDGWGDFEAAEPAPKPTLETTTPKGPITSTSNPPTRIMRASTIDLMTNNLVDTSVLKKQESPSRETQPKRPRQSDPNVLFDADEFAQDVGDDDEFGDFETGDDNPIRESGPELPPQPQTVQQNQQAPTSSLPSLDLLSLDETPTPQPTQPKKGSARLSSLAITSSSFSSASSTTPYPSAPKSPSFSERNPYPGLALKTPSSPKFPAKGEAGKGAKTPTPATAWPAFGQSSTKTPGQKRREKDDAGFDDGWPPFEDLPPENGLGESGEVDSAKPPENWDWDAVPSPQPSAAPSAPPLQDIDDNTPPPTNIPPPSILLSIFPELFNMANTSLFKPLATQTASIKTRVTSDPSTVAFLRAFLLLATVAGHIIAGRKLRWHRDKFLSQGMAISAAGAKGMKLAGVDRAQAAREDREAADVVAAWRENVGRLRSAVAAASAAASGGKGGSTGRRPLPVPELAETMAVTTAKVVPTAPKACLVCGLKRDERVSKVDFEVEDSFGEWWVDHWGHRVCKNFWLQHEKELRQR